MRFDDQRKLMVQNQLLRRDITDENVLKAFSKVERHLFVEEDARHLAYNDSPLSIGKGQTISQPYIVALMMQLLDLEPDHKVLEIGTGSGYQTALLAEIAEEVYTVERIDFLIRRAEKILKDQGYENIYYKSGDGTKGWEGGFPVCKQFDRIIVAAAAPQIPESLAEQLKIGGKLVIPAGQRSFQELILLERKEDGYEETRHGGCTFVPLIGEEGWHEY
ncbi:MAG: protein-L-isoaspartate(D-aspartate) O-methyltransferase [Candidatus Cloacimonetes bacterium]|nr:protein-L-isoaspartate(D-aspartate) O-methyltransferase [Candidatus Cloacimonadota bacterium]MCF7814805.1 protein-L-isoaspartate(D-aspartate) O-methyltransferase [Candidatus Cloacimonadota bacterium]MCF7869200.1 protein-L-isoaspartate(D-aspartate) O-methyltransferase [Candidatus Cloacimonadota bacterium]MCF7884627.1 protein-L-isoaspartate(D-aspartate) O-methyltransferase [Candidatus Cloacimonadota bacterium]